MRYRIPFLISFLALFTFIADANMRAPMGGGCGTGTSLKVLKDLTVLKEELTFHVQTYAGGPSSEQESENYRCDVNARYTVHSNKTISATCEFISPSTESVKVFVNGNAVDFKTRGIEYYPKFAEMYRYRPPRGERSDPPVWQEWSVRFPVHFNTDINTIDVRYTQTAGYLEISWGYFRSSKYLTFIPYVFAPIREWRLAPDFTAKIEFTAPYEWGFTDTLFGQDIHMNMHCYSTELNELPHPEGILSHDGKIMRQNYILSGELPDILVLYINTTDSELDAKQILHFLSYAY